MKIGARFITYSPSITLPLTRSCANRCRYCGYRKEDDGLLGMDAVDRLLEKGRRNGSCEVLLISGESVDSLPSIQVELARLGFPRFADYVAAVAARALDYGLLPHTNVGTLEPAEIAALREVNGSMGLMLENLDSDWGREIHPEKNIGKRLATLQAAGELNVPFTTGLLVGLGESAASRRRSVAALAPLQRRYGHIQEIILQNYVPNRQARLPDFPLSLEDWKELISICRDQLPNVKIQIPPNLNPRWRELISLGADDLGGISADGDAVNPESPWSDLSFYRQELERVGVRLRPRLPVYPEFYRRGGYAEKVGAVLDRWVSCDEFQYYRQ
jgi:7,8-didemethyl-8-hydroxy-5-deazariboflavin synthase CofG subunit